MEAFSPSLLLFAIASTWLKPLIWIGLSAVAAAGVLFVCGLLLQWLCPLIHAIARTTAKEAIAEPLFTVILIVGITGLILFPFIPYNTLGEDIKYVKESGLMWTMILSVLLALWTASKSIADEIEGRTALTLLSKPIGRRDFILGKFLGILWPVAVLFIVFGAIFMASVSYKLAYDARETATPDPTSLQCLQEIMQIAPGLALAFMEAVVMAAISVAISTRLPMMANLLICLTIYLLGHLVPLMAMSAEGNVELVGFIAHLFAAIFPSLDYFSADTSISLGKAISLGYLGLAAVYCLAYCTLALLVALLLFEDRDLA
ncbi:MAG: ABC transporter permease subunit [Pirellulales bacterium]|nr:ABC transporter permease subunit [Pirellulales bacterium]